MKQLSVTFPGFQAATRQVERQTAASAILAVIPQEPSSIFPTNVALTRMLFHLPPVILDWGYFSRISFAGLF